MISTASIQISTYSVGSLSVDGAGVRGEGGSLDPRLVLPVTLSMAPQPREKQLAVTQLTCSLHSGQDASDTNQVGATVWRSFLPELHTISVEKNPNEHRFELRFPLTTALVERLDRLRKASPNGDLRLLVRPKVTVSLVYQVSGEATTHPIVRPIPSIHSVWSTESRQRSRISGIVA